MKKLFIAVLLLITAFTALCQPTIWRAHVVEIYSFEKESKYGIKEVASHAPAVLSLDLDRNSLTIILGSIKRIYYFTSGIHLEDSGIDEDGDQYVKVAWYAIDENMLRCSIFHTYWHEINESRFSIQYDDIKYLYFTTKIN